MLLALEGIDGAGKSTQAELLLDWLGRDGRAIYQTRWNSSTLVKPAMKHGKKERILTSTTFALLEAADLADRYDREIVPALKAGRVVVADRWVYTAFARGMGRGLDAAWLRGVYSFVPAPDLCFYLTLPVDVAMQRILKDRNLKHYEAGMDQGLSENLEDSFREFQTVAAATYNGLQMADQCFVPVDAQSSVGDQHAAIVNHVKAFWERGA